LQNQITDQELVKGCSKEKRKYQELLYAKFNKKMFAVCYRYAKDRDHALDMLQEGFIKVYNHIGKFNHTGSLEGWIRRIMVNTAINLLRKEKYYVEIDEVQGGLPTKASSVVDKMSADEILALVKTLPTGYRTVFNLYAIEGYSHREIAESLDIAESTSRTQYLKAKKVLKQLILKNNQTIEDVREKNSK
jgi:RNA polymerase sigma factor (sigma-70 family)